MADNAEISSDVDHIARMDHLMAIDRMVNEGLGGGYVTSHNGLIEETAADTIEEG
jgi:hypothetical protein